MSLSTRLALIATAVVAGVASTSSHVNAATLATETFSDYGAPSNLQGANGGTGWNGGWNVGQPGQGFANEVRNGAPLSYPGYNGSTTPAASGTNYFNLASGYVGGDNNYNFGIRTLDVADEFSAYVELSNIGANNTTLWGSMLYSSTDGNGHLRLRNNADTDVKDISLLSGSNNLLVFKLNFGTANADTISVWNNPSLAFDPNSAPSSVTAGSYAFSKFFIFRDSAQGENQFDDIRFGTTSFDVVPTTSAVPEPTTMGLLLTGGLLALRRRK